MMAAPWKAEGERTENDGGGWGGAGFLGWSEQGSLKMCHMSRELKAVRQGECLGGHSQVECSRWKQ